MCYVYGASSNKIIHTASCRYAGMLQKQWIIL